MIRLILERDRSLELATATMSDSGAVGYTGAAEVLKPIVEEALAGKQDQRSAFDTLARRGWSNGYIMIEISQGMESDVN